MRIAGIGLVTADVPRLAAFYRTLLGATVEGDDTHVEVLGAGIGFAIQHSGRAHAGLLKGDFAIVFDVDDVDAEHARLKALGVTVLDPPTDRPWGKRNMLLADPDGNHIVFRCPV